MNYLIILDDIVILVYFCTKEGKWYLNFSPFASIVAAYLELYGSYNTETTNGA